VYLPRVSSQMACRTFLHMREIFFSQFDRHRIPLSVVLQSFVGPWPLFQFLNPVHTRYDSLDGGGDQPVASPLPNTNTE
jgi:hypothetical protein